MESGEESDMGDGSGSGEIPGGSPCPDCDSNFKGEKGLARHWLTAHFQELPIQCPVEGCDAQLSRSDHLRRHITTVHSREHLKLLDNFVKRRVGGGLEECGYPGCDATLEFSNTVLLFRHLKYDHYQETSRFPFSLPKSRRGGGGSFKCKFPDCESSFSRKVLLYQHLQRVHKTNPYQYLPQSRKARMKKGQGTFNCAFPGCDFQVKWKMALFLHIRNAHDLDPRELEGSGFTQKKTRESREVLKLHGVPQKRRKSGKSRLDSECDPPPSNVTAPLQGHARLRPTPSRKDQVDVFKCSFPKCETVVGGEEDLKRHFRNTHLKNPAFVGEWEKTSEKTDDEAEEPEEMEESGEVESRQHGEKGEGKWEIVNEAEVNGSSESEFETESTSLGVVCEHCNEAFLTETELASHIWSRHAHATELESEED